MECVLRWGMLLLIAGYLLFAHFGCHEEDNELFAALRSGSALAAKDHIPR
jgi:hypothetical protein